MKQLTPLKILGLLFIYFATVELNLWDVLVGENKSSLGALPLAFFILAIVFIGVSFALSTKLQFKRQFLIEIIISSVFLILLMGLK